MSVVIKQGVSPVFLFNDKTKRLSFHMIVCLGCAIKFLVYKLAVDPWSNIIVMVCFKVNSDNNHLCVD